MPLLKPKSKKQLRKLSKTRFSVAQERSVRASNLKRAQLQIRLWLARHDTELEPEAVRSLVTELLRHGVVTLPKIGTLRFYKKRRLNRLGPQTRLQSSYAITGVIAAPVPGPPKPGHPKPPIGDPDDPGPRRMFRG